MLAIYAFLLHWRMSENVYIGNVYVYEDIALL